MQAVVKPGLMRVRDERASTARKLANEALSLQGNLDAAQNTLSERAEENTALAAQVLALLAKCMKMRALQLKLAGLLSSAGPRLLIIPYIRAAEPHLNARVCC